MFQEHLFAVMRFMRERKLNKKTRTRVTVYNNLLWQAYRSSTVTHSVSAVFVYTHSIKQLL